MRFRPVHLSALCLLASLLVLRPTTAVAQAFDFDVIFKVSTITELWGHVNATLKGTGQGLDHFEFDGKGVDHNGFVRRMYEYPYGCAAQQRCYQTWFERSVYLVAGRYSVSVTAVGTNGVRTTKTVDVPVTTPADSDGDGLPDAWEEDCQLDPKSASGDDGAAGDPDGDGVTNIEEFKRRSNPRGRYVTYFAEGSTGDRQPITTHIACKAQDGFYQYPRWLHARVLAIGDEGRSSEVWTGCYDVPTGLDVPVPPDYVVGDRVVAIVVESFDPLVVGRRTMAGTYAVNDSVGVSEPSRTWYFADGHADADMDEFLLAYNPNTTDVDVEYCYADARREVLRRVRRLPPGIRTTVWVNRDDPEILGSDAAVTITASAPILVERAFRHAAPGKTVPHESVSPGATSPSNHWVFPDVDGRASYRTTLAVLNPGPDPATIDATVYFAEPRRDPFARRVEVGAGLRGEFDLAELGIPPNSAVSVEFRSDVPVVAERVTAGSNHAGAWRRTSSGAVAAGTKWEFAHRFDFPHLAEFGSQKFQTADGELVITNVSNTMAYVKVDTIVQGFDDESLWPIYVSVPALSAKRLRSLPGPDSKERYVDPVVVTSVEPPPDVPFAASGLAALAEIVVERTLYGNVDGATRSAASSVIGLKVR